MQAGGHALLFWACHQLLCYLLPCVTQSENNAMRWPVSSPRPVVRVDNNTAARLDTSSSYFMFPFDRRSSRLHLFLGHQVTFVSKQKGLHSIRAKICCSRCKFSRRRGDSKKLSDRRRCLPTFLISRRTLHSNISMNFLFIAT